MIDNKHINKIILAIVAVALIALLVFMFFFGDKLRAAAGESYSMEYEDTLFAKDSLIEVNVEIAEDDWADLLANAISEEYYACDVTVNGTEYKNVGFRAKGNTSLSMVASSDSDRYSFKISFDQYVDGQSCDGLSKLVLNNNYSDATMMKEAICYDMFEFLGADASLYNYAKVSINGEYYGVYLALEPVEESFALRNYGSSYGELYKPDSMEMGGPGKMKGFDADDIKEMFEKSGENAESDSDEPGSQNEPPQMPSGENADGQPPQMPAGETGGGQMPQMPNGDDQNGEIPSGFRGGNTDQAPPQMSGNANGEQSNKEQMPQMPNGNSTDGQPPQMPSDFDSGDMNGQPPELPDGFDPRNDKDFGDIADIGGFGSGMGSGSGAELNYTDDDTDSYEAIWEGSVFSTTDKDHRRVIKALKNSQADDADIETLRKYIDVDNVLRYMAVQTFVVNLDSLSGTMAHNYYLYESDSQLNLIPWDYNLAFGGFQSQNASDVVNFPIDTPFASGISTENRQFFMALLENEECLAQYHEYLRMLTEEYVGGGVFENTVARITSQISDLVKTDPTSFYTYDEYLEAVEMLKNTVTLRADSINGQLDGTIPATREEQNADSSALIDVSAIDLEVMGTMMGGGKDGFRR